MEYIKLISQTLLDSSAMFLLCNYLSNKRIEKSNKNLSWIIFINLVYIFSRWSVLVTDNYIQPTVDFIGFDILPVNSLYGTFLLCIFLMIANSIYLNMENSQAFFATIASIIIWIFIRILAVVPFKLISVQNINIYEYGYRIVTLLLILIFVLKLPLYKFKEYLKNNSYITKLILLNSLIALLVLVWSFQFDVDILIKNLAIVVFVFFMLLVINIWSIVSQRNVINQQKRVEVMEQYIPVIDDLMSEVRARQHEFNNKLLAIYSILETAETLDDAKLKVGTYSKDVLMDDSIKELFICDNKVISGFIYSKIKLANLKNINIELNICASLKKIYTEEYEIVEILGILIDNAIEASKSGDTIFIKMNKIDDKLEVTVCNPYPQLSNTEFMELFEKGYSTKDNGSKHRGYGLYNVKLITEKCRGKIIFKNTSIDNVNYLNIGILIP